MPVAATTEWTSAEQEAAAREELAALERAEAAEEEQFEVEVSEYFCDGEACVAGHAGGDEEPDKISGPRFRRTHGEPIDLCERCWLKLEPKVADNQYVRFEDGEGSDEEGLPLPDRAAVTAALIRRESAVWERIRNWNAPHHRPRYPPPPPNPPMMANGSDCDEADEAEAGAALAEAAEDQPKQAGTGENKRRRRV